jgi:hypothetical protein
LSTRLGTARDPCERFGGDKHPAMIVERSFSIESITRQLFDELPICLENSAIGSGKVHMLGMSSQGLMEATVLPSSSAIKKRTPSSCVFEPCKRHRLDSSP